MDKTSNGNDDIDVSGCEKDKVWIWDYLQRVRIQYKFMTRGFNPESFLENDMSNDYVFVQRNEVLFRENITENAVYKAERNNIELFQVRWWDLSAIPFFNEDLAYPTKFYNMKVSNSAFYP